MKCPNCGAENRDPTKFCSRCGAGPLTKAEPGHAVAERPTMPLRKKAALVNAAPAPTEPLKRSAESPSADTTADGKGDTRPLADEDMDWPSPLRPQISAADDATKPLPNLPRGFAPLPPGALLHGDRYEILDVQSSGQQINVYRVRDRQPVRRCPNADCGAMVSNSQEAYCPNCGAKLAAQPVYLTYLLREAADPAKFSVQAQLLEQKLDHPGLLLPADHFTEKPYADSRRAYLVVPEFSPPLANTLPVPQKLPQVLDWGLQLARAMAYLHSRGIALRQVDLARVAVEPDGRTARWTNLTNVDLSAAAVHVLAQDVRSLIRLLFYLATGQSKYSPDTTWPDVAREFFSRGLVPQQQPFQSAPELVTALEELLAQVRRPSSITLVVGRRSDVGCERQLNEDGLLVLLLDQVQESVSQPMGLFVVADGMGGHSAGEVATRLTLDAVRQKAVAELLAPNGQPPAYDQWLGDATSAANTVVYEHRRQARTDMGNTLVMALVVGSTAYISNVGDSRAYLIDEQGIKQLTTDHSLVERLVATGKITAAEAATHPKRNIIYRTIGDKSRVEVDLFTQPLRQGDRLLLCSDGLNGMISDQLIFDTVRTSLSPQEACDRLVQAANEAGGADNITVILVQLAA